MSNTEHSRVTSFLVICFNIHNGGGVPTLNCPIIISVNTLYPSPVVSLLERRRKIFLDLTIAPNISYVPRPAVSYLDPPPSDSN
ncbi:11372_t:CDS:2, partial [Funneliformis geosporum]